MPERALRSAEQGLLKVPKTNLKTKGDKAFQAIAPKLWNALPQALRVAASVEFFKTNLKTLLFEQAFAAVT